MSMPGRVGVMTEAGTATRPLRPGQIRVSANRTRVRWPMLVMRSGS
jgi:hypothetical protein